MNFNYASERNKFDAAWDRLRKEYAAAGMSPESIEVMYQYDLHQFNADRAYAKRHCPLNLTHEQIGDTDDFENPFLEKHLDKFTTKYDTYGTHSRYWWLEELDSPKLQVGLIRLTDADKHLLTLYFVEGYTQTECADILHISQCALNKRLTRIFGIFTEK